MKVNTDCGQVRDIARTVGGQCLAMLEQAKELESDLARLKKTLGDDGMEVIDTCLKEILDRLSESQQDMVALTKHLMAFADALERTK